MNILIPFCTCVGNKIPKVNSFIGKGLVVCKALVALYMNYVEMASTYFNFYFIFMLASMIHTPKGN